MQVLSQFWGWGSDSPILSPPLHQYRACSASIGCHYCAIKHTATEEEEEHCCEGLRHLNNASVGLKMHRRRCFLCQAAQEQGGGRGSGLTGRRWKNQAGEAVGLALAVHAVSYPQRWREGATGKEIAAAVMRHSSMEKPLTLLGPPVLPCTQIAHQLSDSGSRWAMHWDRAAALGAR